MSGGRHSSTVAVVPCHREPPSDELLDALEAHVAKVVIVDDGMAPEGASRLVELAAARPNVEVIRLPANRGKGHALAAGIALVALIPVMLMRPERTERIAEEERLDATEAGEPLGQVR